MGKKGKGKKGRTQRCNAGLKDTEPDELKRAPHSYVVGRGKTGRYVNQLVLNFRRIMEPFTATSLQLKKSRVRDLASVAGHFGVSHAVMFSRTSLALYLKLARFPRGPTLTFRVLEYTLSRDVLSSLRRRVTYAHQFSHAPLLILNNFNTSNTSEDQQAADVQQAQDRHRQLQMMSTTLQNLFPSINVHKVQLRRVRRAVLFNYDAVTDTVLVRHYTIKMTPADVSRSVRRLVTANKLPNMARVNDIADFVARSGGASDSEAEDEEHGDNCVQLCQAIGSRGNNTVNTRSAVRLVELGPRLTLKLTKIQSGLMEGDVLYNRFVQRSSAQQDAFKQKRQQRQLEKLQRKQQQEANIKKKADLKQQMKQKSLAGQLNRDGATIDSEENTTQRDDGVKWRVRFTAVKRRGSNSTSVGNARVRGTAQSDQAVSKHSPSAGAIKTANNTRRRAVVVGSKIRKKSL